jgi:hypothetical protein
MVHRLERSTMIARSKPEVFGFFADARNLERITPSTLHFHILTPGPLVMQAGTLIDYELRLHGVPVRWRTLIEEFVPDTYFVDVQVSGPYKVWRHRHAFETTPLGTEMRDEVMYEMPFGLLGAAVHRLFVRAELDRIFDHRNESIRTFFGGAGIR